MELILNKRMQEVSRRVESIDAKVERYIISRNFRLQKRNGQRITTTAMVPFDQDDDEERGCEIFIGKIPKDMFEDEIIPIFEQVGEIRRFRLMVDFSGFNRGYGFVTYYKDDNASLAVRQFHELEVRKGKRLGVYKSLDNCRLFVGGIPVDKTKEDVKEGLEDYVNDIQDVIMYQSYEDKDKNRGFAFLEFPDHRTAAMARRQLKPGALILWDVPLLIDWADPLPDVESAIMGKVTKLYIRNLDIELTNETLNTIIMGLVHPDTVLKTHKILDYAFVHFTSRETAEVALEILKDLKINGEAVEVTWARPRNYGRKIQEEIGPLHLCSSLPPRSRKRMAVRWATQYPNLPIKGQTSSSGSSISPPSSECVVYGSRVPTPMPASLPALPPASLTALPPASLRALPPASAPALPPASVARPGPAIMSSAPPTFQPGFNYRYTPVNFPQQANFIENRHFFALSTRFNSLSLT